MPTDDPSTIDCLLKELMSIKKGDSNDFSTHNDNSNSKNANHCVEVPIGSSAPTTRASSNNAKNDRNRRKFIYSIKESYRRVRKRISE